MHHPIVAIIARRILANILLLPVPARAHPESLVVHGVAVDMTQGPVQYIFRSIAAGAQDELGSCSRPVIAGLLDDAEAVAQAGDLVDVGLTGGEFDGCAGAGGVGDVEEDVFLAVVFDDVLGCVCRYGVGQDGCCCGGEAAHCR